MPYTNWAALDLLKRLQNDVLSFGPCICCLCDILSGPLAPVHSGILLETRDHKPISLGLRKMHSVLMVGHIIPTIALATRMFHAVAKTYVHEAEVYKALGVTLRLAYVDQFFTYLWLFGAPFAIASIPFMCNLSGNRSNSRAVLCSVLCLCLASG
jgi:hypothetical protein